MICPVCEKEINKTELIFYIPFDMPYYNLKIHREHFKECENLTNFYIKYGQICYNYIIEQINIKEKRNGKRKNTEKVAGL